MSLVDYTDIKDEINDAPEPKILPAGTEVKARIVSVRTGISDTNDCGYFSPVFEAVDDPMVKEFSGFFWELNKERLTPKQYARSLWDFKAFCKCFDIDYSRPLSWEDDLPGHEGYVIVGVKKDDTYGEQNTIRKYVTPK